MSPALAGGSFTTSATWEALKSTILQLKKKKKPQRTKKLMMEF